MFNTQFAPAENQDSVVVVYGVHAFLLRTNEFCNLFIARVNLKKVSVYDRLIIFFLFTLCFVLQGVNGSCGRSLSL